METVSFGRTGLKVSRLCFGTMTLGASSWKPWALDAAESRPILKRALDLGINFFDMADWYSAGIGESVVAPALMSMVPRDQLVLTTKAYYDMSDDPNDRGLSRKHLLASIDSSLRRMGTDYVDIFMAHAFDPDTPIQETMEALHDIVRSGKARYLGASTMFAWQFAQMNHVARENGWTTFVNMQCQYSLLYREHEREMLPYCRDQGIAVTCFSPLARGWLAGSEDIRSETDWMFANNYGDALDREICARVKAIATTRGTTMAEVALAWVISKESICCPIVGASAVSHVDCSVQALDFELTPDEIEELDGLYRPRDVINDHVPNPMPRYLRGDQTDLKE
ncbi:MAG: aldo/keto reductase [Chloroflexi bacterium]|nr:MAG: aldo/keto reductase [Chloroflexota bacterium]